MKRSQSAKVEFKHDHPCPATGARKGPCKGYVIDHVQALACGGVDRPENMQWQTIAGVGRRTSGSGARADADGYRVKISKATTMASPNQRIQRPARLPAWSGLTVSL